MKKICAALLILQFFLISCNPALTTRIFPSPLPNLNQPFNKQIGLSTITADTDIPAEHTAMFRSSLAAAFSEENCLVYDLNNVSQSDLNDAPFILQGRILKATSISPDKMDWVPIGIGFAALIVPGVLAYRSDKGTERRETKITVEVDILDANTSEVLWTQNIMAERGDESTVSSEDAFDQLYSGISQTIVEAVQSRW